MALAPIQTVTDPVYTSRIPLWDAILLLAEQWAYFRSKDPNTKVGAVVYDTVTGSMHFGYNGFPAGFPDYKRIWDNRDKNSPDNKYIYSVHAEVNAISKAHAALGTPARCILFVTHFPCHECMKDEIAPSGIKEVVYANDYPPDPYTLKIANACGIRMIKHVPKIV